MSIIASMMEGASGPGHDTSLTWQLAPREREVLHLLSTGRPYKQIAAELELSMGTIRTYVRRLYGKLHVNCRTEAVVKYLMSQASNC
jgi:DNA-binding NarL/FixJ family response regulator